MLNQFLGHNANLYFQIFYDIHLSSCGDREKVNWMTPTALQRCLQARPQGVQHQHRNIKETASHRCGRRQEVQKRLSDSEGADVQAEEKNGRKKAQLSTFRQASAFAHAHCNRDSYSSISLFNHNRH